VSELILLDGGRVALKTHNDPAVERVLGHDRFFLGLDLGRSDPSALVLLRDKQFPEWQKGRQVLGLRTRTVVYADRVRATAYTDIASHVASMLAKPDLQGRTKLCVDATGLGAPFCDVLTQGGVEHFAMTMTAGASWSRDDHRVTVSKNTLLETLASGFETSALGIAHDLPLKSELMSEIASFELASTAAGNLVLQGGGKGHHADMAVALALAFFASTHLLPGFTGVGQLENFYN
jgi:hypothetical protein